MSATTSSLFSPCLLAATLLGSLGWVLGALGVLGAAALLAHRPSRKRRTFLAGIRNLARTSGLTLEEAGLLYRAAERVQPIGDRPFPGGAGVCREWLASYLRGLIFRSEATTPEMKLATDVADKIDDPGLRPPGSIDVVRSLDPVELSFPFLNLCLPGRLGLLEGRKLGVFVAGAWPARGLEMGDRVIVRVDEREVGSRWIRSGTVINYLGGEAPYLELEADESGVTAERRDDFRVDCSLPVDLFWESARLEAMRREMGTAGLAEPAGRRRGFARLAYQELLEKIADQEGRTPGTVRNLSVEGMMVECELGARVGDVLIMAADWRLEAGVELAGLMRCRVVRRRRAGASHCLHVSLLDVRPELRRTLFDVANRLRRRAEPVGA